MNPGAIHLLTTRAMIATTGLSAHRPLAERPSPGSIYCHGSMVDGPTIDLSRVGFGFAAFDLHGERTASAYGTPPWWIDSVPGAETWALDQALRCSFPGARTWSDCLSVVNRFKKGTLAVTASSFMLAKLPRIFDRCDGFADPSSQVLLEWMPAHTSAQQVGSSREGDDTRPFASARDVNAEADRLRKNLEPGYTDCLRTSGAKSKPLAKLHSELRSSLAYPPMQPTHTPSPSAVLVAKYFSRKYATMRECLATKES